MDLFLRLTTKDKIFLFEDRTDYRFNKGKIEAYSVGEIAYALTLICGAEEMYLLGLDLALDPETKQTHSKGHLSSESKVEVKNSISDENVSLRGSEFFVKGNFLDKVPTTPLFDISIYKVNEFTLTLRRGFQKVYNLNNGAYFEDTIPLQPKDADLSNFDIKDKTTYTKKIKNFFDQNSSDKMDEEEKKAFIKRKEDAIRKRELVVSFSKQKYPSIEQISSAFTKVAAECILSPRQHESELSQIFIVYLENIGGYIGDFFNTAKIDNPKKSIKQFQKVITLQFLKIIDKYMEIFEVQRSE
jgi:hypothetical protein